MRTIFIVFSIISSSIILGQNNYKPLLENFNEWQITTCNSSCLDDIYYTYKDTSINGFDYHILDGYHYISNSFLLREDVVEKTVYLLFLNGAQTREYKIYDFSLSVGDSTKVFNPVSPLPEYAGYFVLDSIINRTLIDGEDYRHFYLTSSSPNISLSNNTVWIEGIGSKSLINTPGYNADVNGIGKLSCFFSNLTLHYSNLDSTTSCEQVNTDLNISSYSELKFDIYPNPTDNQINLINSEDENYNYSIFNQLGAVVKKGKILQNEHQTITLSNFTNTGLFYIFLYSTDWRYVMSKKIVKY